MIVKSVAQAEDGGQPVFSQFQFEGGDELAFADSVKKMLKQGLRINFNHAMLLFSARIASSIKSGKPAAELGGEISGLLSPAQVMFGVPEMMYRLEFEAGGVRVQADSPIEIQAYRLQAGEPA